MQKFKTLLLREWMQHHRGWFILALVPLLVAVVTLPFGSVQIDQPQGPAIVAILALGGYVIGVLILAWLAVMIQTPGMARRDQQDRSIEFWVSLPVSHWQSVASLTLMHLVLMPLLVLGLAFVGGQIVAMMLTARFYGVGALAQIPWGAWLVVSAVGLLRVAMGVVLCALWLSPLLLGAMAAAAWLKRWGVPLFAAVIGLGGLYLQKAYDNSIVFDITNGLFANAFVALVPGGRHVDDNAEGPPFGELLQGAPAWLMNDGLDALKDSGSPLFVGALVASAVAFGLLVLRRQRGA